MMEETWTILAVSGLFLVLLAISVSLVTRNRNNKIN